MTTAVSTAQYLFDRQIDNTHPWAGALSTLNSAPTYDLLAVGANVGMDWRVSRAAESLLVASTGGTGGLSSPPIEEILRQYYLANYCSVGARVTFCDPAPIATPASRVLVRVASFSSLLGRVLRDLRSQVLWDDFLIGSFGMTPGGRDARATGRLALELNASGGKAVKAAIGMLHSLQPTSYRPWWAAFHSEVQSYETDGRELADALGLGTIVEDDWLVVYKYRAADAGLLYRPTVVEANCYPFHFVSPPGLPWGVTLPLSSSARACIEVVHHPLANGVIPAACTGELLPIGPSASEDAYDRLPSLRRDHRNYLSRRYRCDTWLDRHLSAF